MKEYGISKKLQNVFIVNLQETKGKVRAQVENSEEFMIDHGLRQ
jgi:hypothetical protein